MKDNLELKLNKINFIINNNEKQENLQGLDCSPSDPKSGTNIYLERAMIRTFLVEVYNTMLHINNYALGLVVSIKQNDFILCRSI